MCIFCIGANDFMLKDKSLLEYTVPYISEKTLVLPITLSKCGSKDEKKF